MAKLMRKSSASGIISLPGFDYIVPPTIAALGEDAVNEYHRQMETMDKWYQEWRVKLGGGRSSNEDARFVLPNAAVNALKEKYVITYC